MKSKKTVLMSADYWQWIGELKKRYRATQIKAAVAVNSAMIEFYWNLGKDISEKYPGKKRGIGFFGKLSRDLREDGYGEKVSLSTANIRCCISKNLVFRWALPTTNSRRFSRLKPNSRNAMPTPKRNSPPPRRQRQPSRRSKDR